MRILIFGINGNLGRYLRIFLRKKFTICAYENLDEILYRLPDTNKITKSILKFKPDIVVNLIAYADVDGCEDNIKRAYLSNVSTISSIVESINSNSIKFKPHLVHISTDHLYDGIGYKNENDIKLLNNYSLTKFLGEKAIIGCDFTILRTNYIGKSKINERLSLGDWIIRSLLNHTEITGFTNIKFNPIHVSTLCKVLEIVCEKKIKGVYNVGSNGYISKYKYAIFLAKKLNLSVNLIKKGKSKNVITRRPSDMRMNVKKFEEDFNYKMPSMDDELIKNLNDYKINDKKI